MTSMFMINTSLHVVNIMTTVLNVRSNAGRFFNALSKRISRNKFTYLTTLWVRSEVKYANPVRARTTVVTRSKRLSLLNQYSSHDHHESFIATSSTYTKLKMRSPIKNTLGSGRSFRSYALSVNNHMTFTVTTTFMRRSKGEPTNFDGIQCGGVQPKSGPSSLLDIHHSKCRPACVPSRCKRTTESRLVKVNRVWSSTLMSWNSPRLSVWFLSSSSASKQMRMCFSSKTLRSIARKASAKRWNPSYCTTSCSNPPFSCLTVDFK
mmetsp:Transcript_27323/g.54699  ORF Transcript_27323/g.54699 Transcript_27323/m.54699 type:complete len:264 (+) Transcript_27323:777-1568(+)